MKHTNIEIKARCSKEKQVEIRKYLNNNRNAKVIGIDNQVDSYFKTDEGRLKIRRGNIENSLIFYNREDKKDSKESKIELYNLSDNSLLEKTIRETHNLIIEVNKKREIYLIKNVKFHLDSVKDLGTFVEIEAISENDSINVEKLKKQCEFYKKLFSINPTDLIDCSYSDMLLLKKIGGS